MTPEQEDEARWLEAGPELARAIDQALTMVMKRRIPWAILIWPHPDKTLYGSFVSLETVREGIEGALKTWDKPRYSVKK